MTVKGVDIQLVIKLGVAFVSAGDPTLVSKISGIVHDQMKARLIGGEDKHLDLSNFSEIMLTKGVTYSLSNKACCDFLFDQINGIDQLKADYRVFRIASNGMRTLESFTKLYGFVINFLDLRNNEIINVNEFHFMKHLDIKELILDGNVCTGLPNYRDKIREIIPSVVRIDVHLQTAASTEPNHLTVSGKGWNLFRNGMGNSFSLLKIIRIIISFFFRQRNDNKNRGWNSYSKTSAKALGI